ncbi:tail fiber protein [Hymenobacter saemangeumensis]|uniref:Tail fiber protein n=1 Tax=Hymenobacter saemangeumensis TaxID=1084522 RepID=A0ABP8IM52_9BACT
MRLLATSSGFVSVGQQAAQGADQERRSWLKRLGAAMGLGLLGGPAMAAARPAAVQGTEAYIGEIMLFAGNFAVQNFAICNGQLLSIAQNTALFSILGTTYGGNGQTTFALPDLRGRFPMNFGQGPGLPNYSLGQVAGTPTVTLLNTQMPAHTHALNVSGNAASSATPGGNYLAVPNGITASTEESVAINAYGGAPTAQANPSAIGASGGSQPFSIMNPYLALNFQICVQGIFPPRQ